MKNTITPSFYISRNFVEFGAFTAQELADFSQRGILCDSDYVRSKDANDWQSVGQWITGTASAQPEPKAKSTTPRKRAAAATKAPKKAA